MQNNIEEKQSICLSCGKPYVAHIGHVLGISIDFGKGLCLECNQKKIDEKEKKELELYQKRLMQTRETWRKACGIPLRYQKSCFEQFDSNVNKTILKIKQTCEEYAIKFSFHNPSLSTSLLMYSQGVWGLGKTYLACATANAILDKWNDEVALCPVLFVSEPQLFLRIRSTYNKQNNDSQKETEEEIYHKLTSVRLLILDDVGKEEVSDSRFVQRVLFAIIDGRYQNMLPMIITANLDTTGLDKHLGGDRGNSASMDRLAEMTGNVFWELKGDSYRNISRRKS